MEPGMERLNKVFETLVLNVGKILRNKGYLFNNLPSLKWLFTGDNILHFPGS